MNADDRLTRARMEAHARLMAASCGLPNDHPLACMLSTHGVGGGALPPWLGLSLDGYVAMMGRHFPGVVLPPPHRGRGYHARVEERTALSRLLLAHRANVDGSEAWIAGIVAAGCMGRHALWLDLGLWSRVDLTALMHANFPVLAACNPRDMKWKTFLCEQLRQQTGIGICRAGRIGGMH